MKKSLYKIGDCVRIAKAVYLEGLGWYLGMSETIGTLAKIKEISYIQSENTYSYKLHKSKYLYPEESLELWSTPKFNIRDEVSISINQKTFKAKIKDIGIDAGYKHVYKLDIDDYNWYTEERLALSFPDISLTLSIGEYSQIIKIPVDVYDNILKGEKIQLR